MCEDISIADDFDEQLGVVSGGVSLLIRPAETNPIVARYVLRVEIILI